MSIPCECYNHIMKRATPMDGWMYGWEGKTIEYQKKCQQGP